MTWDSDGFGDEYDELAALLGVEEAPAFHVEFYGLTSPFWDDPIRGDGTRFPCLGPDNVYRGCLGAACQAETCWAGRLVPSAVHAKLPAERFPHEERKGSTCHTCANVIDGPDGLVDCARGHFNRPITPACLARKRVPDSVPVPCDDWTRASQLRPEVLEIRLRKRRESQRRRSGV